MEKIILKNKLDISFSMVYDDMNGKFFLTYKQKSKEFTLEHFDQLTSGIEFSTQWFISCFIIPKQFSFSKIENLNSSALLRVR
jgi:hypothetical protein